MYYGVMEKEDIYNMVSFVCGILDDNKTFDKAEKLLLGTIAQETHMGQYRDRTEFSAGSGLCQFDKVGFDDVQMRTKPSRKALIYKKTGIDIDKVTYEMLEYNPLLSVIFCRLKYKLVPEAIPSNLEGWARYWKKYYNTTAGKGTEEEFIENYKRYVV